MPQTLFLDNGKDFEIGLGSDPDLGTLYKIEENGEFTGGPVVRTLRFHSRGPGSGNSPSSWGAANKQTKKDPEENHSSFVRAVRVKNLWAQRRWSNVHYLYDYSNKQASWRYSYDPLFYLPPADMREWLCSQIKDLHVLWNKAA